MNDFNALFAKVFAAEKTPDLPQRMVRQLAVENEIVRFSPDCCEAIDMLPALFANLRLRYGDERLVVIDECMNKLSKALEELQLEIDSGMDHNGDFVNPENVIEQDEMRLAKEDD